MFVVTKKNIYTTVIFSNQKLMVNVMLQETIMIGFLLFFGGGYAHQTYGYLFYQTNRPYSALENALYAGLHRITFSLGVAWVFLTYYTTGIGTYDYLRRS
jgi:hypothetical protein